MFENKGRASSKARLTRRAASGLAVAGLALGGLGFAAAPSSANYYFGNCGIGGSGTVRGSGDICWLNTSPHAVVRSYTSTQYFRDQVCAKGRFNGTGGGVVDGSGCSPGGANEYQVYYVNPGSPKSTYGYWAGNGSAIGVHVNGDW